MDLNKNTLTPIQYEHAVYLSKVKQVCLSQEDLIHVMEVLVSCAHVESVGGVLVLNLHAGISFIWFLHLIIIYTIVLHEAHIYVT